MRKTVTMRLPYLRLTGLRRDQFVSLLVAACVLVLALPIVLALWPSQAPASLPNGTTLEYQRAQLSDVELDDCAADWIDADSFCGQATAELDDGTTETIGITREGWVADLTDGDEVVVQISTSVQGEVIHSFHSTARGTTLAIFAAITLALVALSVGGRGVRAFVSLIVSALFIWAFLVTGIHAGGNPLLFATLTAVLVLTVVLHFTHGFSAKTLAAWAGTVCGVGAAMLAGWIFTITARLTGITETTSAAVFVTGDINVSVLSLAALLIALIGILNDITVAQASVVFSLLGHTGQGHSHDHGETPAPSTPAAPAAPAASTPASAAGTPAAEAAVTAPLTRRQIREQEARQQQAREQKPPRGLGRKRSAARNDSQQIGAARGDDRSLLRRAMTVGQDHAASAIYTVSFSVVGASLAAFVAAKSYGMPVWALLQSEDVAHTIVQLLAGIVGLTVTMPATTLFAIGLARLLLGADEAQGQSAPTNSRSAGSSRRD